MKYLDKRDNRDIIEHIQRRYFIKGSACAFLSLGVLIFFYVYGFAYFADRMGDVNGVFACLIGMAIPFFALKLHRDVFDKSWEGEIVSRKVYAKADRNRPTVKVMSTKKMTYGSASVQYIILTVRTENDIITVDRPAAELARFGAGERLRHIKGTKYLQACRPNGVRDCVMCGAIIREEGNECPHCGFSLVKFERQEDAS